MDPQAWHDLAPDEIVTEEPTGFDAYGAPTGYRTPQRWRARIVGKMRAVRDASGQERTSSVQALVLDRDAATLTVRHRYTLPARYAPRQPSPLAVSVVTDESGPHHVVVWFA